MNLRIAYTNNEEIKILKSELKYQNMQMAGLNFQYSVNSIHDFKGIMKGKYLQNALVFEALRDKETDLLNIDIYLDNEKLFFAKFHNSSERKGNVRSASRNHLVVLAAGSWYGVCVILVSAARYLSATGSDTHPGTAINTWVLTRY